MPIRQVPAGVNYRLEVFYLLDLKMLLGWMVSPLILYSDWAKTGRKKLLNEDVYKNTTTIGLVPCTRLNFGRRRPPSKPSPAG